MRTLLAALVLVSISAPAFADDLKGDLAKIQGKWSGKVGPEKNIPIVLEVKDKALALTITYEGQERTLTGEVALDETKSPKQWTSSKFKTPGGDDVPENKAIYKFDGDDTLILCSGGPGNDRPNEFKAGEGGPPMLTTFTRVKKEEKDAPKGDLAKIQGKWKGDLGEIPVVLVIKDNSVVATLTIDGQERTVKGEISLSEDAAPKQWTWTKVTGLNDENSGDLNSIYRLDGDTLVLCTGGPGDPRPSEFKAGEGGPPSLVTFTRVKDEKK